MSFERYTEAPSTSGEVVPEYSSDFAGLAPRPEKVTSGEEHLSATISHDPLAAVSLSYSEYKYKPTYEIDRRGNIISHDSVLNSSPVALLHFIEEQTSTPPTVTVSVRGRRGAKDTKRLFQTVDFSFVVPATPDASSTGEAYKPLLYTMGEWDLACRGKTVGHESADKDPRCQVPAGAAPKRTVSQHWRQDILSERSKRSNTGLPGFINPASLAEVGTVSGTASPPVLLNSYFVDLFDAHAPVSSQTQPVAVAYENLARERADRADDVRIAVEQYCSSGSSLKELTIIKETYGYNWEAVVAGVRAKVVEAWALPEGIIGCVDIKIHTEPQKITIRPNNTLAWTFSESMLNRVLLSAVLAYPLICAAEIVVGARFDQFRAASPLVRWKLLPAPADGTPHTEESALRFASTLDGRPPKVSVLPDGHWVFLVGMEEGEWFRKWEGVIEDAVKSKKRGQFLLQEPKEEAQVPTLRGY